MSNVNFDRNAQAQREARAMRNLVQPAKRTHAIDVCVACVGAFLIVAPVFLYLLLGGL